jgi:hypothetical protein
MGDDGEVADIFDGYRAHGRADNIRVRKRQGAAVPKAKANAVKLPVWRPRHVTRHLQSHVRRHLPSANRALVARQNEQLR